MLPEEIPRLVICSTEKAVFGKWISILLFGGENEVRQAGRARKDFLPSASLGPLKGDIQAESKINFFICITIPLPHRLHNAVYFFRREKRNILTFPFVGQIHFSSSPSIAGINKVLIVSRKENYFLFVVSPLSEAMKLGESWFLTSHSHSLYWRRCLQGMRPKGFVGTAFVFFSDVDLIFLEEFCARIKKKEISRLCWAYIYFLYFFWVSVFFESLCIFKAM